MSLSSGVYLGKKNVSDYDLISTGDYVSPVVYSFKLQDSKTTLEKTTKFYFIISNTEVQYIKLEITGQQTAVRLFLSLDNNNFDNLIEINDTIDAIENTVTRPFYIKAVVDDDSDFFVLNQITVNRNYKLRLTYA